MIQTSSKIYSIMTTKEAEESSVCSEDTNSICDEQRTRKLFQACDTDGDGYLDCHDLENICRQLHLGNCIEELMGELGADEDGKISFEKFFNRKCALKPEIRGLKKKYSSRETNDYVPASSSNNSLGKHECWEFDSGARDLSPEPSTLQRLVDTAGGNTSTGNLLQLANKLHLAALASLRAEISELNTRLQSVTEERDILESALKKCQEKSENSIVQRYEEQITELHSVIAQLTKELTDQKTRAIIEEDETISDLECDNLNKTEFSEENEKEYVPKTSTAVHDESKASEIQSLRQQQTTLKQQFIKKEVELRHTKMLLSSAYDQIDRLRTKLREKEIKRLTSSNTQENNYTLHQICSDGDNSVPVLKVAERVKLPKVERPGITGSEITNLGVSHTEVAEHLVSGLQAECNLQELSRQDKKHLEIETERLHSKLEHLKAQNNTLQISMHKTRENCEKIYLLLGKYESNAIALKLSCNTLQHIVDEYQSLVCLLTKERGENTLMSKEERDSLSTITSLKKENAVIIGTVVELESYHSDNFQMAVCVNSNELRKLDLEMAVLMQDLMEMRETNAELRATVFMLNRERETLELKVTALQSQLQAFILVNNSEQDENSDKGTKLQERLKEVAVTLENVNKNADIRQKQSLEFANQLKNTNCALMKTLERCKRKSQLRLRKLETEMTAMMDKHAAQVKSLKQRIAFLEDLNREKLRIKQKELQKSIPTDDVTRKEN